MYLLVNDCPVSCGSTTSAFITSYSAFHAASDATLASFALALAVSYAFSATAAASDAATASEIVDCLNVPSSGFASSAFALASSYSAFALAASASASESVDGFPFSASDIKIT